MNPMIAPTRSHVLEGTPRVGAIPSPMKSSSSLRAVRPRAEGVPPTGLRDRLSRLYELAQSADFLFGSPLGPLSGSDATLPQFVYFGPRTSDVSPRLAVVSGLGRHDLAAARAVLAFVERLALQPEIGHALNVSFFPVANVLGLLGGAEEHDLAGASWTKSPAPELALLAQDSRVRGYQGYVVVATTPDDEPTVRVRTVVSPFIERSNVEVFNSAHFAPWAVTFETHATGDITTGPLSLADDLPFAPFAVEVALPADWSQARADAAVARVLKRLLTHYRGFVAYGQHL